MPADRDRLTRDAALCGRVSLWQKRRGYRFALDALLLAGFVPRRRGVRALEIGGGCGVVSLVLARQGTLEAIDQIEIQPDLAELARLNAVENGLENRVRIVCGDVRAFAPGSLYDLIVANPPWLPLASGQPSPRSEAAFARHELTLDYLSLSAACGRLLKTGGELFLVYRTERMADLFAGLRAAGLEPKELRLILPRPGGRSKLFLIRAVRGAAPGLVGLPVCFVHAPDGGYSDEVRGMLGERGG